jgi:hypothetical protein
VAPAPVGATLGHLATRNRAHTAWTQPLSDIHNVEMELGTVPVLVLAVTVAIDATSRS